MDRKDYISDNLVRMSDRLKQNAAARYREEPAEADLSLSPRPASAVDNVTRREQDNLRSQRDLSARIAKECSELAAELELMEEKSAKLRLLKELYDKQLAALQELDPQTDGTMFGRNVDLVRIEYYRLSGRRNTLSGRESEEKIQSGSNVEPLSLRGVMNAALVIAGAIVLAGFVLTAALAMVFR